MRELDKLYSKILLLLDRLPPSELDGLLSELELTALATSLKARFGSTAFTVSEIVTQLKSLPLKPPV